jgi:hypothetical protein
MSTVAVDRLPSAVREIENLWIPLSDADWRRGQQGDGGSNAS